MAIAHLQDWGTVAAHSGTVQSSAAGAALTNPSTLIVFIWLEGDSPGDVVSSVTDDAGNHYVKDAAESAANNFDHCEVWSAQNTTTTASNKITVNLTGNGFLTFTASEFSGLLSTSYLDGAGSTNNGTNSVTQPNTGTFSTTNANDLLIATFADGGISAETGPSGFTLIGHELNGAFECGAAYYQIVSATQSSIDPTWSGVSSNGSQWAAVGMAYKATGGGGGTTYTLNVGGSSTPAGAMTRQVLKSVGGSSTPAGSLAKQAGKPLSGSSTAAGALSRMMAKSLAGSAAAAATVAKQAQKTLAGSSTPAGSLNFLRVVARAFNGAVAATGSLTRTVGKGIGGAVTGAGSLIRAVGKLLAGTVRAAGSLVTSGGQQPVANYPIVLFTPDYPQAQVFTPDYPKVLTFTPEAPE